MRTFIILAGILLATIAQAQRVPDPSAESELFIKVQLPNYAPWGSDEATVHEAATKAGLKWKDSETTGLMRHITYGTDSISVMFSLVNGLYSSFAHIQVMPTSLDATTARAAHKLHYLNYAPEIESSHEYTIEHNDTQYKLSFIVQNSNAIRFSVTNMTLLKKIAVSLKK